MVGCDEVYYCVVDTRAWLRDPAPLFRTNVEGARSVMTAALAARVNRIVHTSSVATLKLKDALGPIDETSPAKASEAIGDYKKKAGIQ